MLIEKLNRKKLTGKKRSVKSIIKVPGLLIFVLFRISQLFD